MNQLAFPLRVYEKSADEFVVLVSHDPSTGWSREDKKSKADATRQFVNWLRRQFKDRPTEFKYLAREHRRNYNSAPWSMSAYRTVKTEKHFLAYGLTAQELMLIKLSWQFTQQKVEVEGSPHLETGSYVVDYAHRLEPSEAALERVANKRPLKDLPTS